MRVVGWERRLAAAFDAHALMRFSWGIHDCCQMGLDAIEACTGTRPPILPYGSEREAARLLRELGGMEAAAQMCCGGAPAIDCALAQRGDLVLVTEPTSMFGHAFAVCAGRAVLAPAEFGLVEVPAARHVRAWRV